MRRDWMAEGLHPYIGTTMSAIKLPELPPEVDTVRALFRGQPDHFEAQDYYYTQEQMRAYAEHAVREALEQAAVKAVETLKDLTTEMEGYSYFGSNPGVKEDDYDDVAEAIRSLIPEKDHG